MPLPWPCRSAARPMRPAARRPRRPQKPRAFGPEPAGRCRAAAPPSISAGGGQPGRRRRPRGSAPRRWLPSGALPNGPGGGPGWLLLLLLVVVGGAFAFTGGFGLLPKPAATATATAVSATATTPPSTTRPPSRPAPPCRQRLGQRPNLLGTAAGVHPGNAGGHPGRGGQRHAQQHARPDGELPPPAPMTTTLAGQQPEDGKILVGERQDHQDPDDRQHRRCAPSEPAPF